MAQQTINVGTNANDGTGDTLRTAGQKVNSNFTEVYGTAQSAFNKANTANALAQAAYNYANTIVSDTQVDPYARSKANAAYIHANAAFDQANTNNVISGNISIASTNSAINFVSNSSGDGNGYSTIELRPDVSLLSDQYIVIDPTSPGHIHIRAGGTQDASGAYLYFGGEQAHFQIEDDNHSAYIRTYDSSTSTLHTWAFNGVGSITFPDATEQTTAAGVPGFRNTIVVNTSTHNASNTEEILLCDPNAAGSNVVVNLSAAVNNGKIFTIKNINPGGYSVNVSATTIEDPVSKSFVSEVVMSNTGEVYTWVSQSGVYRHIG